MYTYKSISGADRVPKTPCVGFYKYDGSNLRFEWSPKAGWCKFGTRRRLFGKDDEHYGQAIGLFMDKYADGVERVVNNSKTMRNARCLTVFAEFVGPQSFAGQHVEGDDMDLIMFDVHIHKKGILGPREFLDYFGDLGVAEVVFQGNLSEKVVEDVRNGILEGTELNEGVVFKGGSGHELWMCKVKTRHYLERLKSTYGADWEKYWE